MREAHNLPATRPTVMTKALLALSAFIGLASAIPSSDIPTGHTPAPFTGGPITPFGCGYKTLPDPILANCTDPIVDGMPDISGLWQGGPFMNKIHWERIEQCGVLLCPHLHTGTDLCALKDRIVWTSGCVVHDFRHANGKVADGVHGTALTQRHA